MKSKKLMLCMLLVIIFSLGTGINVVYADEQLATVEVADEDILNVEDEIIDTDTNIDVASDSDIDEDLIEDEALLDEEEVADEEEKAEEEEVAEEEKTDTKTEKETSKTQKEDSKSEKVDSKAKEAESKDKKVAKKETTKKEEAKYTKSELRLLSALIYTEAGNQSYKGKLAVANVVLNRVSSKTFWHTNSIKEVIYDSKWGVQFSVIKKGSSGTSPLSRALSKYDSKSYSGDADKKNMEACIKAAKASLNGDNNIGSYLYFNGYSKSLANKYKNHIIIGEHIFYNR